MKIKAKRFMAILLSIIFIILGLNSDSFASEIYNNKRVNEKHLDVNNSEDLQQFMDEFFKKNMDKYSVPGAAIAVVKDSKEVFKKGYGYSDVKEKVVVDPDKTVFPAASVSKLFTATAIMQLQEEEKIDLNESIDKYIEPYKVINNYKEPVTCRNLLTHSSGVDEASELNGGTKDEKSIKSQEYYFDNHTPRVVREPNTVSRYCNQGYNLLGYIVEKVSGISYEEYIKKNILEPLKMGNSLVRLKNSNTAKCYGLGGADGTYNESPLIYQYTSGSSGINATVKDMENFMIAHLNNGEFQGKRILNEKTSIMMKEKQFSNDSRLAGMGYGFIRSNRNGQEILKHEGALPSGSTTTLFLMPKEGLGIYIATNSLNPLPFNFEEEFLDSFYPSKNNNFNEIKPNSSKDFSKYEGTYRSYDGIAKSNIMKIGMLFDPSMDIKIKDNKDGTLTLKTYTHAKEEITTTIVEKKDGLFARKDGKGEIAFKTNDNGKVTYAFNDVSHDSFEKISFFQGRVFNIVIFAIAMGMFIINIIRTIFLFIKRKFRQAESNSIKLIRTVNLVIDVLNVVGIIGAIIAAVGMISINDFTFAYLLYTFLGFLTVSTVLSIFGLINLIYIYIKKRVEKSEKIYFIMLTITNFIFIWFIYYFNFLGFKI